MNKLLNILSILMISITSVACADMEYMNRKSYSELRKSQGAQAFLPTKFDNKKVREYGGLVIKNDKSEDSEDKVEEKDNFYVSLKRQKKRLYAETLLYKSDNQDKSLVDETLFDFGYDRKHRRVSLNLTLRY